MKKQYCILCALFFISTVFPENHVINIQHWELKNKTNVFFVQRSEVPMLDAELIFDAGSARDGDLLGLSALTNSMIGESAQKLSANQIAQSFDQVGAQFNHIQNRDIAGFSLRTMTDSQYLDAAVHTFSSIISTPTFSESELERVKQQQIGEIQLQHQDPWKIADLNFFSQVYKNSFYANDPLGDEESVHAITQAQLIEFYKRYYTGVNANLILVGDLTTSEAKEISQRIAGELPEGAPVQSQDMTHNVAKTINYTVDYSSTQSTILIGQVGINPDNPNYFSLLVGNTILGASDSSLLFQEVREKRGLAYAISSEFTPLKYRGPFLIALQTKTASVNNVIILIKKILKDYIENGPTDAQFIAAKRYLIEKFPLMLASNHSVLNLVSTMAFYHYPLDYWDTYQANVQKVSKEEVKKSFQKTIQLNRMVTVVVG